MSNSRERLSAQVSSWHPSTNEVTSSSLLSTVQAYGLRLRHTITGGQITGISTSGGVITYTCLNSFVAGDRITITGVTPTQYNLTDVQVLASPAPTLTQFSVSNAATGTYVSGGDAFTTFTIPTGITWVYVIMAGGGGGSTTSFVAAPGGGAGGVAGGGALASKTFVFGSGGVGAVFSNKGG